MEDVACSVGGRSPAPQPSPELPRWSLAACAGAATAGTIAATTAKTGARTGVGSAEPPELARGGDRSWSRRD